MNSVKSVPDTFPKLKRKDFHINPLEQRPAKSNKASAGHNDCLDDFPRNIRRTMLVQGDREHPGIDRPNRATTRRIEREKLVTGFHHRRGTNSASEALKYSGESFIAFFVPVLSANRNALVIGTLTNSAIRKAVAILIPFTIGRTGWAGTTSALASFRTVAVVIRCRRICGGI